jgi:hypothetical protein
MMLAVAVEVALVLTVPRLTKRRNRPQSMLPKMLLTMKLLLAVSLVLTVPRLTKRRNRPQSMLPTMLLTMQRHQRRHQMPLS